MRVLLDDLDVDDEGDKEDDEEERQDHTDHDAGCNELDDVSESILHVPGKLSI